uniref:Uncharacterized protein n=1 Tax=Anguilla anguilla TaxID=7936 RepID=A0A0E9VF77_ANGAN
MKVPKRNYKLKGFYIVVLSAVSCSN